MTTLHNRPALVGCIVHDCARGSGTIKAVSRNCIHVQFGGCSVLKYTCDGFQGKSKLPTLFWQPMPLALMRLMQSDPCKHQLQIEILTSNIKLMDELICADCPEDNGYCCEDDPCCPPAPPPEPCCPPDPCDPEPLKVLKTW